MKKTIVGFILGAMLTFSMTSYADTFYQFALSKYQLYVDGERIEEPMYIKDGVNHIPLKAVSEALGADITVNGDKVEISTPKTDIEEVAAKCKDSCVMIYAYQSNNKSLQGSGWIYNGYVITAKHVVQGAKKIEIFPDDKQYGISGEVYYLDKSLDFAILKINTDLPSVVLGDSDKVKDGEKLVSITSPKGFLNSIDECISYGKGYYSSGTYLQVSESSMASGSSGGAIFNMHGEIVAYAHRGENSNMLAIPVNQIKQKLEGLG
jgi:S1-C subfamily serine protease